MSPRPAPSTHDDLAVQFLQAGARLVDALLSPDPGELPARLRTLHFPAPLGWIRVEDVLREVKQGGGSVSAKAFWNRWPDKDSFLVDLATYAITEVDAGGDSTPRTHEMRPGMLTSTLTFSERIAALTSSVMQELLGRPRSFLLVHLAAVVHHAPRLAEPLRRAIMADNQAWIDFYESAATSVGLRWRPGWDAPHVQLVLKALLDGLLIGHRVTRLPGDEPWDPARVFSDGVTALFSAVVDLDDGRTPARVLDDAIARRAARAGSGGAADDELHGAGHD